MVVSLAVISILSIIPICVWAEGTSKGMLLPNVMVLVLNRGGPFDQVCINYTSVVSKKEAMQDLDRFARESSCPVRNLRITVADTSTPGSTPTTSSVFETPMLVNLTEGTFVLEPFISALRRFKMIEVNYLVMPQFSFRGLKDFESKWVKINLTQAGNSYRYRIHIKNSNFDRLGLPLREPENVPGGYRTGASKPIRILVILVIAVCASLLAYMVAARFRRR
ncbi:MAG: hypothetical protein ACUVRS_08685 [Armatimonadota bacterium]